MDKTGVCMNGNKKDTKLYTYFEAEAACAKLGLRLCTKAETLSKGKVRVGVRVRVRVRVRCLRQPGATPVHQGRDTVQRCCYPNPNPTTSPNPALTLTPNRRSGLLWKGVLSRLYGGLDQRCKEERR